MNQRKFLILLAMSGMLVAFDQLTKFWVISNFRYGETASVIENYFNLTRVHNTGAAFGLLSTLPNEIREPFFFLVPGLTLVLILFVFVKLRENQRLSVYALSMIIGGALGNLADRMRLGYVIDFLDFHWNFRSHFPAFNIADSAITVGVFLLLAGMVYDRDDTPALLEKNA